MPRYESSKPHSHPKPDCVPDFDHPLWNELTSLDHGNTIEATKNRLQTDVDHFEGMRVAMEDLFELLYATRRLMPHKIRETKERINQAIHMLLDIRTRHASQWRPMGIDPLRLQGVLNNRLLLEQIVNIEKRKEFVSKRVQKLENKHASLSSTNEALIRSCIAMLMELDPTSDKDPDYQRWIVSMARQP